MSKLSEEVPTITSDDFGFKKLGQATILPSYNEVLPFASLQNLAISNEKSRYIATSGGKVVIGDLQILRDHIQNDSEAEVSFLWERDLKDVILVEILSDDTVIIAVRDGMIYSTDLNALGDLKRVHKFAHTVVQVGIVKSQNMLLVLDSDGRLHSCDLFTKKPIDLLELVASFDIFGNEVYIFSKDYSIQAHHLKHDTGKFELQSKISTPEELTKEFQNQYLPLSINILDKGQALLVYGEPTLETDADVMFDHKMFIMNNSGREPVFQESFDIAAAFGSVLRYPTYYNTVLPNLVPNCKVINILASSCSSEVTIWDSKEIVQPSQDSERAVLPISRVTDNDTNPIGIALDVSTAGVIANPCPGVDSTEELPLIYILNNEGSVQIVGLYHASAIKGSKFNINATREHIIRVNKIETTKHAIRPEISTIVATNSANTGAELSNLSLTDVPKARLSSSSSLLDNSQSNENGKPDKNNALHSNAKIDKPTFGNTGKDTPDLPPADSASSLPFGKPQFGKPQFNTTDNQDTFGKPVLAKAAFGIPEIGTREAKSTKPSSAFSKPLFGSTESNPTFGKPLFGNAESTSTFGKPSFGNTESNSTFGKPSFGSTESSSAFGKPSFGSTESSSAFSKSSFGNTESSPAFGKPSFGSTESSSAFGKPSFGSTESSSAFGKPSFGSIKSNSVFGKPSFSDPASNSFKNLSSGGTMHASEAGKQAFSGFASFNTQASTTDNPFISSSNKPSPFAALSSKQDETTINHSVDNQSEKDIEFGTREALSKISQNEASYPNLEHKPDIVDDKSNSFVAGSPSKSDYDETSRDGQLLHSPLESNLKISDSKHNSNLEEAEDDDKEGNEEEDEEEEDEEGLVSNSTDLDESSGSRIEYNIRANGDELDEESGDFSLSRQTEDSGAENSDVSSSTDDSERSKELTTFNDSTIENTPTVINSSTKISGQPSQDNPASAMGACSKQNANLSDDALSVHESNSKIEGNESKSPFSLFANDLKTASSSGFSFANIHSSDERPNQSTLGFKAGTDSSYSNVDATSGISFAREGTENSPTNPLVVQDDQAKKEGHIKEEGSNEKRHMLANQSSETETIPDTTTLLTVEEGPQGKELATKSKSDDELGFEVGQGHNFSCRETSSEESYDALDDITQDELESAMDSDQIISKRGRTLGVSLEEAAVQVTPEQISQGYQTDPIENCDFEVQAFQEDESHVAIAHLPRSLEMYFTGASLGQIKYCSKESTMKSIEKSYHLLSAEMKVLSMNVLNLNNFFRDQSMNNLLDRSIKTVPNIYTWRISESGKFNKILEEQKIGLPSLADVQTIYEDVTKVSEKDLKCLLTEFKRYKHIFYTLQTDESNSNLSGLRYHQSMMQSQLRIDMSLMSEKLSHIENSLQILKLCTVRKEKLGGNPLVDTLSRELFDRQNLLSNIARLREEIRDLKLGKPAIKGKEETNISLIKSEIDTINVVNAGLLLTTRRQFGNIIKSKS